MCEVTLRDKVPTVERRRRLGIFGVFEVLTNGRLLWFGQGEHKANVDWVSASRNMQTTGGRSRLKKTWGKCLKDDMKVLGLNPTKYNNTFL